MNNLTHTFLTFRRPTIISYLRNSTNHCCSTLCAGLARTFPKICANHQMQAFWALAEWFFEALNKIGEGSQSLFSTCFHSILISYNLSQSQFSPTKNRESPGLHTQLHTQYIPAHKSLRILIVKLVVKSIEVKSIHPVFETSPCSSLIVLLPYLLPSSSSWASRLPIPPSPPSRGLEAAVVSSKRRLRPQPPMVTVATSRRRRL